MAKIIKKEDIHKHECKYVEIIKKVTMLISPYNTHFIPAHKSNILSELLVCSQTPIEKENHCCYLYIESIAL